jgi:hypothetical protein
MKETWMNTHIKRLAAAAALLAIVALSGCASIEGASWWTTPPQLEKLPGDSLGYQADKAGIDVA